MPQQRINLAHSGENRYCGQPQHQSGNNAPPRHDSKNQHRCHNTKNENQFAITAQQQMRAIRGLMKRYFSRSIHLMDL
jgi:hypothetical protein